MLTALHIQNFVLIDQATLALGPGLTALTGETGAGKSILLDALGVVVGGRADRGALRQGAERGTISATFDVDADHPVWTTLAQNDLPTDDDVVILRRVQTRDGKSRAFINDQPVGATLLRAVGEQLLEAHGQHDGRGLLSATFHREMLDEFGGLESDVCAVSRLYGELKRAREALETRRQGRARAAADADYLRHVVDELDALRPAADEERGLAARRAELMASERLGEELVAAAHLLGGDGIDGKLEAAMRRLDRAAAAQGPENAAAITSATGRIASALAEFEEARAAVDLARRRCGFSPQEQTQVEERLFALRAAARKHGVAPDGLPGFLEKARRTLAELEAGEAGFEALEKALAGAEGAYNAAAQKLSADRRKAAAQLDVAVARELAPLKLGRAHFETQITTREEQPQTEGFDQVEFMVATNPGVPAGPLKTIASGGELSRFVLAMKAALAAKERRTVIIFDEVDAGVGGAVADAVGERLARLAQGAQVLVVTHSPQVAARAQAHWRVEKRQTAHETTTRVDVLSPAERVEEIARMLSGAEITDEARAAAVRLLSGAAAPVRPSARARRNKAG